MLRRRHGPRTETIPKGPGVWRRIAGIGCEIHRVTGRHLVEGRDAGREGLRLTVDRIGQAF